MATRNDILNTMAAPQGAGAAAAMEQNTQDMSINQVYILINIF